MTGVRNFAVCSAFFMLGVFCTSMVYQFLDTSPEVDLEAIQKASAEFQASCESTVPGSSLASFLMKNCDSVLGASRCKDGVCMLSIGGGSGMFYDVCTVDYEESTEQIIETFWIYGDQ
ncbi:MAG: hypothetical protein AAGL49_07870 [Pseudomonadota bacterium]